MSTKQATTIDYRWYDFCVCVCAKKGHFGSILFRCSVAKNHLGLHYSSFVYRSSGLLFIWQQLLLRAQISISVLVLSVSLFMLRSCFFALAKWDWSKLFGQSKVAYSLAVLAYDVCMRARPLFVCICVCVCVLSLDYILQ